MQCMQKEKEQSNNKKEWPLCPRPHKPGTASFNMHHLNMLRYPESEKVREIMLYSRYIQKPMTSEYY